MSGTLETSDRDIIADLSYYEHHIGMVFDVLANAAHKTAKSKGFWDTPPHVGTCLMNAVSELAECNEYLRKGNPPSDHIPRFSGAQEEIADCIIRLLDLAAAKEWDISGAILAKMRYNITREHMNGGKKY